MRRKVFSTGTSWKTPPKKWIHYSEICGRLFSRFCDAFPLMIEIGVFGDGSLEMWREFSEVV
jgi:hypothetical protein